MYMCKCMLLVSIYLLLFFVIVTAFATDSCTSLGSNLMSPNTLIHTPCLSISSLDKIKIFITYIHVHVIMSLVALLFPSLPLHPLSPLSMEREGARKVPLFFYACSHPIIQMKKQFLYSSSPHLLFF